jgi:DNA-binding MarR family transcriptional regulator
MQLNQTTPHRSAFTVINAPVLYSSKLNDSEKIIYGHISNLSNEYGYCYATNSYLAELTGKSLAAVKRAIKKLSDLQFIEITHVSKNKFNERQITLAHFPKSFQKEERSNENQQELKNELGHSSEMSHPQLKNELPGGSKMSHRIIKEEYINKITTTTKGQTTLTPVESCKNSSSFFKCKEKIQELENLSISSIQKEKIYRDFEKDRILNGLKWLESVGTRINLGGALYDAIKHGYKPKISQEKLAEENRIYAQEKLGCYDNQTINGYKIDLCKEYVLFSTTSGRSQCFEYLNINFKDDVNTFCKNLGINFK